MKTILANLASLVIKPGNPLGYKNFKTGTTQLTLSPCDTLILFTDGFIENEGPKGEQVKIQRSLKSLESNDSTGSMKDHLLGFAENVWQNHPADDDVTLLILKWNGQKKHQKAG